MKKIITLSLSSLLLLTGCSGYVTEVSDGDETLMTIGDTTYTKSDEYELLKASDGADETIAQVEQIILDKEIGRDEDILKEAQEQYDSMAEDNEEIEDQIKEAGYEGKDDYIEKVLVPSVQADKLISKYFTADKSEIKKTYKPSVAKILQCDDEETAEKALEALKNGTSEDEVFETYESESSSFANDETLITTSTTELPTRLINKLYKAKSAGVIDEVFTTDDESDTTAYVAILVNNDYDEIVDEVEDSLASDSDITTNCLVYYMKKYNFEVHDQEIFDELRSNYPEYLVNYPELSESSD